MEAPRHEADTRTNFPAAEYQSLVWEDMESPLRVACQWRNRNLDPHLVWRGEDEIFQFHSSRKGGEPFEMWKGLGCAGQSSLDFLRAFHSDMVRKSTVVPAKAGIQKHLPPRNRPTS